MQEFLLGTLEITLGMSLLILLMLVFLKCIGGKFTAKCRYILWTLVLIRLAVPFSFGILPALIEVPVEREPIQKIQMQVPAVEYTPTQQNPVTVQPQEQGQIPTPPVQTPVFMEPDPDPMTWEDMKAYFPHLYLTGAAVFLLWNLLAYGIYTAKILRPAREADSETKAIYDAVCRKKGLRRVPKLLVSQNVNSPAAFGLLCRRIVLPDISLTENGLAGTLAHEVTHCKRGDLWIKAVCLLARSFHWFNPLVHLAAFRCEMEMELSCDEAVLAGCDENTRAAYGEVMLDIIKRCRRNRGALTTHFNPKKNAVKARFANILYGSGKKRGLWLIAVCLVLCLIAGTVVACRTEETADETEEETQQNEILSDMYEQYQNEYTDLQVQLKQLDNKYADLTAYRETLQTELQELTSLRENLQTQLAGMPEDTEKALQLWLTIQEYEEEIKGCQLAVSGIDSEIALAEAQRQTIQEKLQAVKEGIHEIEAEMGTKYVLPEGSGEFPTMEAYVTDRMAQESTITYYSVSRHHANPDGGADEWTATANVIDTKLIQFEKKGELDGLASDGVLECWEYRYYVKLDVPAEDVMTVDGDFEGWFDMVGQHSIVALRYPDGTYAVLRDAMVGDGIDFFGYHNTYEEAIYDWYVAEYGLDLPLYVEDWTDEITAPEGAHLGNQPVHRYDGDGWGIYIPIAAWYQATDVGENQWRWCSSYLTGSELMVDVFNHSLEEEYAAAEKQGYTPTDRTNRVWENHTDGTHRYYYYYENPKVGFWRVTITWTDEGVSSENSNVVIEPQLLKLMAESFVVFGTGNNAANALTVTSPIYRCDDVYRGDITPTHGEGTITFPDGLDGYKLYTCEVQLCTDGCDPHDVVYRNYFGYAGGFPLQKMEITKNGSYTTGLWLFTYPEEILEQILSDMEKGGASEEEKQAYRNKRVYLYHLTIDKEHCACIFIEPENIAARPENEQEILDAMVASVEITMHTAASADPDTLYQTFLDTVISPYSDYIVTHEFLDLDGNGIDELIIYDWGASANCGIEIFTIENGEVRSFSTTTSGVTHYSGEPKSLAPPSANAVNYSFWGLPTSYSDKTDVILWFNPCTGRNGHVLYSMNGSDVHTSEDYYYFTSDANGNLTVEVLRSFYCEAIDSNPANGWKCYINGEEVSVRWFRDTMGALWQDLSVSHGVQYHEKNTASRYEELEAWVEDDSEEIVQAEEPSGLVSEDAEPYTYTYEEWIKYSLYTDFGFRDPVDVSALTDAELTTYMADAYQCALDIYFLFEVNSDRMYARTIWSSTMPHVEIDGRHYTQMYNPVFPTLAALESYMNGVLSPELTEKLLSMGMFIDYEGALWGMMGARGTNISMKTIGFSITSRTDTEIIYTAEVEVREADLSAEEPDYVEYYDFTYALTEDGWRWTDFYLYN